MPMMAVYEQNDARHSARVLAGMTLQELEGRDEIEETVLLNMFRLLDGFRSHAFYGIEDEPTPDDDFSSTSMMPSGERHIGEVRLALENTVEELGGNRDELLETVEGVLRFKAYPDLGQAGDNELKSTIAFFEALVKNLRRAGA